MLMELAEEQGYTFIHPFDDPGSCNRSGNHCHGDHSRSFRLVDYILVPIGGGGLATGVSTLAKLLNPQY